jgi:hypothetical protein
MMTHNEHVAIQNVEKLKENLGSKFKPRNRHVQQLARFLEIAHKKYTGRKFNGSRNNK